MDSAPVFRNSPAQAWARALSNIAQLKGEDGTTLPLLVDGLGTEHGDQPAFLAAGETLSYRALAERKNQYARWALGENLKPGDVVCLLMGNCPDYVAIWLGISQVGAVVALINTNLTGEALAYALDVAAPSRIIVDDDTPIRS